MLYIESDAIVLSDYLSIPKPEIVISAEADRNHLINPRLFAFVVDRENKIHFCKAIESVDPDIRIGLLLHELGHIHGGMDEVVADEWVIREVPESRYHYVDEYVFKSPVYPSSHPPVKAKNIQCVGNEFTHIIGHREED